MSGIFFNGFYVNTIITGIEPFTIQQVLIKTESSDGIQKEEKVEPLCVNGMYSNVAVCRLILIFTSLEVFTNSIPFKNEVLVKNELLEDVEVNTISEHYSITEDCYSNASVCVKDERVEGANLACNGVHQDFSKTKEVRLVSKEERVEGANIVCSEIHQDFSKTKEQQPVSKYRKYACDVCTMRFKRKYLLKEHREVEHGKKAISCDACGNTFAQKSTLKRHIKRFHSLLSEAFPFQCEICSQRFNVPKKFSDHKKTHLKPDIFKCRVCGKVYANSFALRRHSDRHSSIRYKCHTCKRSYKTREDLQKHVGIHTGQFWCDVCFKVFSAKGKLSVHKKRHLKEHTYVCIVCGQCFQCNVVRMNHQEKCGQGSCLNKAEEK